MAPVFDKLLEIEIKRHKESVKQQAGPSNKPKKPRRGPRNPSNSKGKEPAYPAKAE